MEIVLAIEKILIEGMTCGGCSAGVERALSRVNGVASVSVSFDNGVAEVEFDQNVVTVSELCDAIEGAGFDVPKQVEQSSN